MSKLTRAQKKFIELEKKKEEFKLWKQELNEALEKVKAEVGLLGNFQDDEGTVYQVVEPDGRFVYFDKIGYARTRRTDEKKGSLSLTAAKALGYDVK